MSDSAVALLDLADLSFERPAAPGSEAFQLDVPRFVVSPGARIALAGPSGCGKTTLLDILCLVLTPADAGCYWATPSWGRTDVRELIRQRRQRRLEILRSQFFGYARQVAKVTPFLTAIEALEVRQRLAGRRSTAGARRELLAGLGLDRLARRRPHQLSEGQRQRLSLACALSHTPMVVVADEPTAALDAATGERVMGRLSAEAVDGRAVVISTHDPDLAERHGFRVIKAELSAPSAKEALAVRRTRFATPEAG